MGNNGSKRVDDDSDYTTYNHTVLPVPDTLKQFQRVPHMRTGSLALLNKRGISSWFCACTIDAPVACRVALYLRAREDFSGRVHSTYMPTPVLALNYDPGMGQSFPGKFASEIQLSSPPDYIRPDGDRYPVLLRIESLAPAYASRYTLDNLPAVGSSVTKAMCVHTVFAHLKLTQGAWDVEVLREHLWLAGNPFLLSPPADVAAYQTLLQKPRLAATPAQLRERRLKQEQEQEQANKMKRMQADAKQKAALAAQQPQYPDVWNYTGMVPDVQQLLPQSMPLQLPVSQPQYGTGAQGLAALPQAAPVASPFVASQGFAALPPAAPLPSPFAGGLSQQNAVRQPGSYPLVAQFA